MDSKEQSALAERLGARIAEMRLGAEMTQAQLADKLGIGDEAVSRFERGAVMPTLPRIFDLADAFGRGVAELMFGVSDREADQAATVSAWLGGLAPDDRAVIVGMVDQLVVHLRSKAGTRSGNR